MFTVTNSAASHLAERLAGQQASDAKAFTFSREDHGWRLQLCERATGDVVIQHDGAVVMVLDSETASRLANRRLELADGGSRPRLRMPQASTAREALPDREIDE
jgi:hypothetical protein